MTDLTEIDRLNLIHFHGTAFCGVSEVWWPFNHWGTLCPSFVRVKKTVRCNGSIAHKGEAYPTWVHAIGCLEVVTSKRHRVPLGPADYEIVAWHDREVKVLEWV